jgi:hypothetical protein
MNSPFKIIVMLIVICLIYSCSSTLHVYEGRQYLPDEELGSLSVTEIYRVYKFDGKELEKTLGSTVIKAKPGHYRLELINKDSKENSNTVDQDLIEETIYWDAIAGHEYQLVSSGAQSDKDKIKIIDVTNNQ